MLLKQLALWMREVDEVSAAHGHAWPVHLEARML